MISQDKYSILGYKRLNFKEENSDLSVCRLEMELINLHLAFFWSKFKRKSRHSQIQTENCRNQTINTISIVK